jgi:hypothetical protein
LVLANTKWLEKLKNIAAHGKAEQMAAPKAQSSFYTMNTHDFADGGLALLFNFSS